MGKGKFIFLAGNCIVNPYLPGGHITIPLTIPAIKKFLVNFLPDFISVYDPYVQAVLLPGITAIYVRDALIMLTSQE
jgi:hypothetical protein